MNEKDNTLQFNSFPINNEYIMNASLNHPDNDFLGKQMQSEINTIVIIDHSGSMGNQVERLINKIFPEVFVKLHYKENDNIYFITFETTSMIHIKKVSELSSWNIRSAGYTYMNPAIKNLHTLLTGELNNGIKKFRILTISDGEIFDQQETQSTANYLKIFLEYNTINSQAVRFYTSVRDPDTRALCSILQLNNKGNLNLINLHTQLTDNEIITNIVELFKGDDLAYAKTLKSEDKNFKKTPIATVYTDTVDIFPGDNLIWLNKLPNKVKCDDQDVKIVPKPELTHETYEEIFKPKLQDYVTNLKVKKIINTENSTQELNDFVNYFENVEKQIMEREQQEKPNDCESISQISTIMEEIKNDNVDVLDSSQQAEYIKEKISLVNDLDNYLDEKDMVIENSSETDIINSSDNLLDNCLENDLEDDLENDFEADLKDTETDLNNDLKEEIKNENFDILASLQQEEYITVRRSLKKPELNNDLKEEIKNENVDILDSLQQEEYITVRRSLKKPELNNDLKCDQSIIDASKYASRMKYLVDYFNEQIKNS